MTDRFRNTAQPDRDWWEQLWPDPDAVVEKLGVEHADRVVDVCAGDGLFTLALAEWTEEPVYAVDIDEELLGVLDSRARDAGHENVESIAADARALDDALPEPVEFALLANTFHGVDDQSGFAAAVRESLTDDGRFAVVNWHDRPRTETTVLGSKRGPPTELRMTPEETAAAVTAAGFEHVDTVDLPPYHYGAVFRPTR